MPDLSEYIGKAVTDEDEDEAPSKAPSGAVAKLRQAAILADEAQRESWDGCFGSCSGHSCSDVCQIAEQLDRLADSEQEIRDNEDECEELL